MTNQEAVGSQLENLTPEEFRELLEDFADGQAAREGAWRPRLSRQYLWRDGFRNRPRGEPALAARRA
jgi:hypothetical protein